MLPRRPCFPGSTSHTPRRRRRRRARDNNNNNDRFDRWEERRRRGGTGTGTGTRGVRAWDGWEVAGRLSRGSRPTTAAAAAVAATGGVVMMAGRGWTVGSLATCREVRRKQRGMGQSESNSRGSSTRPPPPPRPPRPPRSRHRRLPLEDDHRSAPPPRHPPRWDRNQSRPAPPPLMKMLHSRVPARIITQWSTTTSRHRPRNS